MSMGGGKGQAPAGQTTTTQAPLPYMYPYIGTALQQASDLYAHGGAQYYPGQAVAGFSQPQQAAMQKTFDYGMGKTGQGGLNAASRFDKTLLSGQGSNPWLDQTFQQAAGATQNQLASEFAGAGRNTAASEPLRAEQLNHLATDIYGGAYQNDIQNALTAGNQAQSIYNTKLSGLNAAEGVGQQVQNLAQQQIDAQKQHYAYDQQLPYQNLQQFEQLMQAVQPGSQTTSPYFNNPGADAMNMALMAQQLYKGYQGKGGSIPAASSTS